MVTKYETNQRKLKIGRKIGITETGRIVFYKEIRDEMRLLDDYTEIDLFYDDTTNSIGINRVVDGGTCIINLTTTPFICVKKFFKRFNIPIVPGRYDYTVKDGMFVIPYYCPVCGGRGDFK